MCVLSIDEWSATSGLEVVLGSATQENIRKMTRTNLVVRAFIFAKVTYKSVRAESFDKLHELICFVWCVHFITEIDLLMFRIPEGESCNIQNP